MSDSQQKSNELLSQEITYIKDRLSSIEKKLDEKYVSHETFDLVIKSIHTTMLSNKESSEQADTRIIKTALWIATPMYAGVIALLLKLFLN